MADYRLNRKSFYLTTEPFWYDLNQTEYSLFHALPIKNELVTEIRTAAERMGKIFQKVAILLRSLSNDQLLELGFPASSLPFLKMKTIFPETVIGRFDFAVTREGIKLLEFNSDTPTFIMECFKINGLAATHFGLEDPNALTENTLASAIETAIFESAKSMCQIHLPNVVFTAHEEFAEDWNTTLYLSGLCRFQHQVLPLSKLRISGENLIDEDGLPIDILYRQTYPFEQLMEDVDPLSYERIGIKLLELVQKRKLTIINPPSAFLLQPKTIQALIWGLAEEMSYFNEEERDWIKKYMLPTYLDPDDFIGRTAFVKKPSIGREGDSVEIYDQQNHILLKNSSQNFLDEMPVYQQYIDLPQIKLETEKGFETLSYLFGAFLIAGKPSAIGIRAGEKITGNDSYFLPVGIQNEEAKNC